MTFVLILVLTNGDQSGVTSQQVGSYATLPACLSQAEVARKEAGFVRSAFCIGREGR